MNAYYKILLAATLLANFGDNLIGPFYAVFVKGIGGSILDIGYTVSLYAIATGILTIIVGRIGDRYNKELLTTAGYALYALGSLGYLLVRDPMELFFLQIVFAVATALLSAPLSALFAKYIDKGKESTQWALESGGGKIAVGVAVFAGTLIVNFAGFTVLFIVMCAIQVMATLLQFRLYIKSRTAVPVGVASDI